MKSIFTCLVALLVALVVQTRAAEPRLHLLCSRSGTLIVTYNPGPTPHRFPLLLRTSRDEGITWSEPTLLADRPAKGSGWSICYPTLTELPDGALIAIWAQKKDSPGELYGDIHSARIVLRR